MVCSKLIKSLWFLSLSAREIQGWKTHNPSCVLLEELKSKLCNSKNRGKSFVPLYHIWIDSSINRFVAYYYIAWVRYFVYYSDRKYMVWNLAFCRRRANPINRPYDWAEISHHSTKWKELFIAIYSSKEFSAVSLTKAGSFFSYQSMFYDFGKLWVRRNFKSKILILSVCSMVESL